MPHQRIILEASDYQAFIARIDTACLQSRMFSLAQKNFYDITLPLSFDTSFVREVISQGRTAAILKKSPILPEALFFDMDATVIAEESLVEIAKVMGKEKEIEEITTRAMAGGLEFKDSLTQRLKILKGLQRDALSKVAKTINPGFDELATWCHSRKIPIFLISGGFVEVAEPVAKKYRFTDYKANRFAWVENTMAGHTEGEIVDAEGKKQAVEKWCSSFGFNPQNCIAVGDGANDRPMMKFCGLAAGHSPKKVLWDFLHIANQTGDHRFLLECLNP